MSGAWWACHWCDWEAPFRRRLFDRYRATREYRRHLREQHPDFRYDNEVLWGRRRVARQRRNEARPTV